MRRYFAIFGLAYLSHWRLVLEQSPITRRQIPADLIVRDVLDVLDGRAEQLVLQQTRIRETVACRLPAFPLLFARLRRVLVGLCEG